MLVLAVVHSNTAKAYLLLRAGVCIEAQLNKCRLLPEP